MSAPDPAGDSLPDVRECPLLVIVDPVARRVDGESVRIAKDVLCAGAAAKICLPQGPEEVARALARRGSRRPVVVGDDRAFLQVVRMLQHSGELSGTPLAVVPVGGPAALGLTRSLGVPQGAVGAARTALDGQVRPLDLLRDDSGGLVLGGLRIPSGGGRAGAPGGTGGYRAYEPYGTEDGPYGPPAGPAPAPGGGAQGGPGQAYRTGSSGAGEANVTARDGAAGGSAMPGAPRSPGEAGIPSGRDTGHGGPGTGDPGEPDPLGGHRGTEGPAAPTGGPAGGAPGTLPRPASAARPHAWWTPAARTARSALALLTLPVPGLGGAGRRRGQPPAQRLRVEADGVLLADLDRPVARVAVSAPGDGLAAVVVHPAGGGEPLHTRARAITVSGPDFHYRADALTGGPVRTRTWTVLADAWQLLLPRT
ncbi:hypothetical protein ACZ90_44435 [Streptomyces albus subsp. albus]|nr:hypothetical protein ACZ90_44435 [Streptomyces albus subsp. albus]